MGWTAPRTWTAAEVVTAAIMNTHVRDNLTFVHAFRGAKGYRTANQTGVVTATDTPIQFDNEEYDTDAFHDNATNNSRFTVPTGLGGWYRVTGRIYFAGNATGLRNLYLRKNGTTDYDEDLESSPTAGNGADLHVCATVFLNAGDYVEMIGRQTSGGNLDVIGSQIRCHCELVWQGA